jgi:hypothetical protein
MKNFIFFLLIIFNFNIVYAQKIYSTSQSYKADLKVYVVENEYQADLKFLKFLGHTKLRATVAFGTFPISHTIQIKKFFFVTMTIRQT